MHFGQQQQTVVSLLSYFKHLPSDVSNNLRHLESMFSLEGKI